MIRSGGKSSYLLTCLSILAIIIEILPVAHCISSNNLKIYSLADGYFEKIYLLRID